MKNDSLARVAVLISVTLAVCARAADAQEPFKKVDVKPRQVITVTNPNGGEELRQGWDFVFRWRANPELLPTVRVLLEDDKAVKHLIAATRNTGTYRWTVSPTQRPGRYKLIVSSADGKMSDASDAWFEILPPEVELTCGFLEYGSFTESMNFVIAGTSQTSLRFTVFVENKGTRTLSRVFFGWALLREPLNDVMYQDAAGFSNVHPDRRYSTTFEYTYKKRGRAWFFVEANRTLAPGDYRFEFEVDPDNEWGEPDWARENNKCEASLTVK